MTMIDVESIVKTVKLTTEDGVNYYITLHYDTEFKSWDGQLSISWSAETELKTIQRLLEQCKELGSIDLKSLDIKLPTK